MQNNRGHLKVAMTMSVLAVGLGGCADEYFQRSDPITTYAGDAVRRNIAIHTINPRPNYAYDNRIQVSGQRMETALGRYHAGGGEDEAAGAVEDAEFQGPDVPGDPQ